MTVATAARDRRRSNSDDPSPPVHPACQRAIWVLGRRAERFCEFQHYCALVAVLTYP
jgi:hypothetical protein